MISEEKFAGIVTILVVISFHLMLLAPIWTGWSWAAVITCFVVYQFRGLGITAGYHRYFSHKSFKTSRWFQFVLALWGCSALQGTPREWTRNHRHHHRYSDKDEDLHSPTRDGFWYSHMGWIFQTEGHPVTQRIPDLDKYPEIRWLAGLQLVPIFAVMFLMYWWGEFLGPEWGTNGVQMVVWGFFISTVVLWHCVYSINSLTHMWGRQRYESNDDSKNSFLIAIFTLGEGWHNNHHKYPSAARNGFFWWEYDPTFYLLKILEKLGLIWDLRKPPAEAYGEAIISK